MSRIGRLPVPVPQGAKVTLEGTRLTVEGPKGTLSVAVPNVLTVEVSGEQVRLTRQGEDRATRALHGLYRALVANMVHGSVNGFSKDLDIVGVGYRADVSGKRLTLHVGFSHPTVLQVPEGLTVEVPKPTTLVVKGADKQLVGQFAATIRRMAPPEPYKGKGIRYANEPIRRKAGKAATGAGAKAG